MANIFVCQKCGQPVCVDDWLMGEYPWSWQLLTCMNCGGFAVLVDETDEPCDNEQGFSG